MTIEADIYYTRAAPPGDANGVHLCDPKSSFGLKDPKAFRMQHGTVLIGKQGGGGEEETQSPPKKLWNDLVPVRSKIENGRPRDYRLLQDGFELVSVTDETLPPVDPNDSDLLDAYARLLERTAVRVTGAKAAFVYAHTWRGGQNSSRYANYAHTDVGPQSWCLNLKQQEAMNNHSRIPPGLENVKDQLPHKGAGEPQRYAVVTAWRLLEGGQKSHLAMLDHDTLDSEDILSFTMMTDSTYGSNYRLKFPEGEEKDHRWIYWPDLDKSSELIFFLAHDSTNTILPKVHSQFHAAFVDPNLTAGGVDNERRSVDTRMILIF